MALPAGAVAGPLFFFFNDAAATEIYALSLHVALPIWSGSLPLTVALLVMAPGVAGALTLIVTVALAPDASEPTLQVTVLPATVHTELVEGEATPAGRVSLTTTPVAGLGPLLVALML